MERYDAIVIGAGQGGIPLAANLADAGWSVALVERKWLGGSCINYGCTPTKAMVASARVAHAARTAGKLGVRTGEVTVDLAAVVDRKDGIVESFREGLRKRVDREGLEIVRGEARFAGPGRIRVEAHSGGRDGDGGGHGDGDGVPDADGAGGRELASDRIVVDVGARPVVPPIDGLDDVDWLDSTVVMELTEVPDHLVVVGGGYVGCEFAQMFRRFGAEVTVVQFGDQLLPAEDPEVAEVVAEVFRKEGIDVRLGTRATAVTEEGGGIAVRLSGAAEDEGAGEGELETEGDRSGGTETVRGSHLLVAAGRRPATEDLGLEEIGLETDERGAIPADERLRTAVDGVWAIGDANGSAPFTNVSYDDFRILYENWMNGRGLSTEGRHHTAAVFVDPPVARVGLNERMARERGVEYEVATTPMSHVARAIEKEETAGLLKVLVAPGDGTVLGASLVGLSADEVVHVFTAVMDAGLPYDVIEKGVYVHPAVAEALPVLVRKVEKQYA